MIIRELLDKIGIIPPELINILEIIILLFIAGVIGWLTYIITKKWLAKIVIKITKKTKNDWDNLLFDKKFFSRLGLLIAPIAILIALSYSSAEWSILEFVRRALRAWITLGFALLIGAVLDGANRIYETYPISRDRPLTVFVQVIMVVIYCVVAIIMIGILSGMGNKIFTVLGGMAIIASVGMIIFQDTILGFVAGIQLSANNMVRIGDWIEMPSAKADGDVMEIGLTTVKVQNWDKTITTIPTYKLVKESFVNWRGMQESKGRRIKRSINIDVNSIRYLNNRDLEMLKESRLLQGYIDQKIKDLEEFNSHLSNPLDARKLTNIGTFREYMGEWLSRNPNINQEMTRIVRQLQPGPTGLPLEIYCFSAKQAWVEYEQVQADIFDHMYAILNLFDLRAFEYTTHIPKD